MSNFNEASDAIRRVAKLTEGFQLAAKALDDIGSLDNAAKEAQAAAAIAFVQRDEAVLALEQMKLEFAEASAKQKEAVLLAQGAAKTIIADAEQAGLACAALIVSSAQAQAEAMRLAACSDVSASQGTLATLQDEVALLVTQELALTSLIVEKQIQLSSITSSLDELKAKLG